MKIISENCRFSPVFSRHVGDAPGLPAIHMVTVCHVGDLTCLKGLVSARGSDEPVSALTSIYEGADLLLYWPYE